MNAHTFALPSRTVAPRAGKSTVRSCVDFAGRSVHLDPGTIGPVVAWYFGVTPRRDATILALGRSAWRGGRPDAQAQAHAAALIEQAVSVLLVDLRRSERPWSAWIGCTRERVIQAALSYLEDRGYDIESARVVHAC